MSASFELPFSEIELQLFVTRMAASGRQVRSAAMLTDERKVQAEEFGSALFAAVFDDDIRALLRSSREAAQDEGKGLRLRLRLDEAPELNQIPWEYLHGSTGDGFLALQTDTPIVRYAELPLPTTPPPVQLPLSVLVMISDPTDLDSLAVDKEWNTIVRATAALREQGKLVLDRTEQASLAGLHDKLRQHDVNVFHYIGHGAFHPESDQGVLAFKQPNGNSHLVPGDDLGMNLANAENLRLVVLNTCEGARSSLRDPFAGVAQSLVERGIPAVVAMQFKITDNAAQAFCDGLYTTICEGRPIDESVTHTRVSLYNEGNYAEWATPVLYMRAGDGHIFGFGETEAAPERATMPPPVPPPPGPLEAKISENLARADLPLTVRVGDAEVVVEGVVDDERSIDAARDLVTASLASAEAPRFVTMKVESLADRVRSALAGTVDGLEVDAGPDTLTIRGTVNTAAESVAVMEAVAGELSRAGVERQVSPQLRVIENSVLEGLARGDITAEIDVTGTDLVIRLTDPAADEAAAERTAETVLGALGIGRMVHVRPPASPPPAAEVATSAEAPPPEPLEAARPQPDDVPAAAPAPPPSGPAMGQAVRAGGGRRLLPVLAAIVLAVVVAGIVIFTQASDEGPDPQTTTVPTAVGTSVPTSVTSPTTPPTTLPPVDLGQVQADVEAAATDAGAVTASANVEEVDGEIRVTLDAVVLAPPDRPAVIEAAAAAAGEGATVVAGNVIVLAEAVEEELAQAGFPEIGVTDTTSSVILGGSAVAASLGEIETTVTATLDRLGVGLSVDVTEIRLSDVEADLTALLADAGYEGAGVTATVDLIEIEYETSGGVPVADVEAAIEALYEAAPYTQRLELVVSEGTLPLTGPADVGWTGLALVMSGAALLAGARRVELRRSPRPVN